MAPYNTSQDQIRVPKGYYSAPPERYWPRMNKIRLDLPLANLKYGRETYYWQDVLITAYNPIAMIGNIPLHRTKPLFLMSGIFHAAKTKSTYRIQLASMLSNRELKEQVTIIMGENKTWMIKYWFQRKKRYSIQIIKTNDQRYKVEGITLYEEPVVVPFNAPDTPECFVTKPQQETHRNYSDYPRLHVYAGEHHIHTYDKTEISNMGDEIEAQIVKTCTGDMKNSQADLTTTRRATLEADHHTDDSADLKSSESRTFQLIQDPRTQPTTMTNLRPPRATRAAQRMKPDFMHNAVHKTVGRKETDLRITQAREKGLKTRPISGWISTMLKNKPTPARIITPINQHRKTGSSPERRKYKKKFSWPN